MRRCIASRSLPTTNRQNYTCRMPKAPSTPVLSKHYITKIEGRVNSLAQIPSIDHGYHCSILRIAYTRAQDCFPGSDRLPGPNRLKNSGSSDESIAAGIPWTRPVSPVARNRRSALLEAHRQIEDHKPEHHAETDDEGKSR